MKGQTIVIGVSGGIAAFKILELIKNLRNQGHNIFVIMTESAAKMISPREFNTASGNKVFIDLFSKDFNYQKIIDKRKVDHIELADSANLLLIAPATANIIAKLAAGIADDFLTTTALATKAPIIIFPSMNVNMWHNQITRENIKKLQARGYLVCNPDAGQLACGYEGEGRLPALDKIQKEAELLLERNNSLKDQTVLVTAGGTSEKIDDVRFITNKSSGKMGVAIAENCYQRGAKVILLRARSSVKPSLPVEHYEFESSGDLELLVKKFAPLASVCFHAAAVSDFIPEPTTGKIASEKPLTINLQKRNKIYETIKKLNPKLKLVIFKAEWQKSDERLIEIANEKLQNTDIDAIILNDVGLPDRGFSSDYNEAIIVTGNGKFKKLLLKSKKQLANQISDYLIKSNILSHNK